MATKTRCRRVLMSLVRVTVSTGGFYVLSKQWVIRCIVVKLDLEPISRIVAIGTGIAEKVVVNIVLEMAVHTNVRCITVFFGGRVTSLAPGFAVFTNQFKVRELVVEARFIQIHDVGSATFVIRMARGTSLTHDLIGLTVKTDVAVNVVSNIFMTIATQSVLTRTIKRNVARRAFRLEFRMPLDEIARHDQRLNRLSGSGETCEASKHCH